MLLGVPRNDPSDHFGLEVVPSKGLQMSDDSISSLFDRVVPTAGEKGVEVSRIAGALGRCDVDDKATTKLIKQKTVDRLFSELKIKNYS